MNLGIKTTQLFTDLSKYFELPVAKQRKRNLLSFIHCLIQATKIAAAFVFFFSIDKNIDKYLSMTKDGISNSARKVALTLFSYDAINFIINKLFYALFYNGYNDVNNALYAIVETFCDVALGVIYFNSLCGKNVLSYFGFNDKTIDVNDIIHLGSYYNLINQTLLSLLCLSYGDFLQATMLWITISSKSGSLLSEEYSRETMFKMIPNILIEPFKWIAMTLSKNHIFSVLLLAYALTTTTFKFNDKVSSVSFLCHHFLFITGFNLSDMLALSGPLQGGVMFNASSQNALVNSITGKRGLESTLICSVLLNMLFDQLGGMAFLHYNILYKLLQIQYSSMICISETQSKKVFSSLACALIVFQAVLPLIVETILIFLSINGKTTFYMKAKTAFLPCCLYSYTVSFFNKEYTWINDICCYISTFILLLMYSISLVTDNFAIEKSKVFLEKVDINQMYEDDQLKNVKEAYHYNSQL